LLQPNLQRSLRLLGKRIQEVVEKLGTDLSEQEMKSNLELFDYLQTRRSTDEAAIEAAVIEVSRCESEWESVSKRMREAYDAINAMNAQSSYLQ
jgi:hypothetical protein